MHHEVPYLTPSECQNKTNSLKIFVKCTWPLSFKISNLLECQNLKQILPELAPAPHFCFGI